MEPMAGVVTLPRPSALLDAARNDNEFTIKNEFSVMLPQSII